MVKIKDVARHAGVSPATVSRVLAKSGIVKKETEDAVLRSIQELNYSPNVLAQRMRQQKTRGINVIVPDITNPFFGEIFRGIEQIARENEYEVYIVDVDRDPSIERRYIAALAQRQVDGIISLSATMAVKTIETVSQGFPVVVAVQNLENAALPNVGIDNVQASKDIVKHLISLGHRKIAYLTTSPELSLYRDRTTGYMQALAEAGVPIDMNLVCFAESNSLDSGYERARELLLSADVTAICAAGDELALGAIKAARDSGLRVPEDLSVTGFDDIEYARFSDPGLTTVWQPRRELGREAMRMMLEVIRGTTSNKRILEHKIIVRGSTAQAR